jgi:hypothetical protein
MSVESRLHGRFIQYMQVYQMRAWISTRIVSKDILKCIQPSNLMSRTYAAAASDTAGGDMPRREIRA